VPAVLPGLRRARKLPPNLSCGGPHAHNGAVTDGQFRGGQFTGGQAADPCPQCGSTAGVHSISELAALAQMQLNRLQPGAAPQPNTVPTNTVQPQAGAQQGRNAEPRSGPVPGWAGKPQAGPPPGSRGWQGRPRSYDDNPVESIDQAVADVALGAAARFIGRAVSKRVQRTVNDRVAPALAQQVATLREQIVIAEQHPDIRACLTDHVVFLAGGNRVLPMPSLGTLTSQQADTLVAQLRQG
jgi:hypothetical protein